MMLIDNIDVKNAIVLKKLNGHSGCFIDLMYDANNDYKFVRKASNESYSGRLHNQLAKQKDFAIDHYNNQYITAPAIRYNIKTQSYIDSIRLNDINNCSTFYMDYVPGKTLAESIDTLPIKSIKHFGKILHKYFDETISKSTLSKLDVNEIDKKLNHIWLATNNIQNEIINKEDIINTIEYLLKILPNVHSMMNINSCDSKYCHGDFTLENMIINNNKLYLIDFLDSYINCVEIDYAKILQDILLGWSYRYKQRSAGRNLRLSVLFNEIQDIYYQHKISIDLMLLINVLRIVPYCKNDDEITAKWLNERIKFLSDINMLNLC